MAHSHTLLQVVFPSVDFLYFPGLDVAADDVSIRSHLSSKSTRKSSVGGMCLGVRLSLLFPGLEATTTGTLGTAQSPTVPTKRIEMCCWWWWTQDNVSNLSGSLVQVR